MVSTAAILFAILSVGVCVFQLALLFGAPWGELTLGGKWPGKLPLQGRLVAAFSACLMLLFSVVILSRAGVGLTFLATHDRILAWVVVAYCVVGTVANALTPSPRERKLWLPVVICLLACSLVVAVS